ncbi:hypothetical protein Ocin01_07381 [Orchesella cincta]|uniref:XK-related protein n=1 Tax=Orchesella cincta TaxID=48709 RepID=A0A1D2N242_ORCCI|nr:hypothetical protein Ocin01_07381 [Orchesella cincta]
MESSSSPVALIGAQRSNNTTPHHHYYSSPSELQQQQPLSSTFINGGYDPNPIQNHNGGGIRRGSHPYKPISIHHPPSNRLPTPRSRGQSPSVNSLGAESNILMNIVDMDSSSLSPHIIGHGLNHLHDDSHIHINCDSSHSISPPNSNSNTTISCGSGNSTSANIGVPTNNHHHNHLRNGRNINNNNRHKSKESSSCEDYENYRNNRRGSSGGGKKQSKKSILEDDEKSAEDFSENRVPTSNKFKQRPPFINPNQEFLPICDALFNMISLAAYFCDVVFDVLTVYSWYKVGVETEEDYELSLSLQSQRNRQGSSAEEYEERSRSQMPRELMWQWSLLGLVFILTSAFLSQTLSFKWYKSSTRRGQKAPDGTDLEGPPPPCSSGILALMHVSLLGVLWRYFKLFIPVDLRFVKNEVRDLCLLRLIHAFCEAAPIFPLQSLHGVVSLLRLLGTCLFLKKHTTAKRPQVSPHLAWSHLPIFLETGHSHVPFPLPFRLRNSLPILGGGGPFPPLETNSRTKVVVYYITMFLENSLLLAVYLIAVRYEDVIWFRSQVTWSVYLCFGGGLCFMGLYYRYFHVKKLSYVYDAESSIYRNTSSIGGCSNGNGAPASSVILSNGTELGKKKAAAPPNQKFDNKKRGNNHESKSDNGEQPSGRNGRSGPLYKINGHHIHHPNVPGVFNCRFHPAMKRKKKKPTSFVPPPAVASTTANNNNNTAPASGGGQANNINATSAAAPSPVSAPSGLISHEISQLQGESPMRINNKSNLISPVVSIPQPILPEPTHLIHQHLDASSSSYQHPHHHHSSSDHYDNNSGVLNTHINSSMSVSAHYDLPEGSLACYDPNGRGGDGSASSSYGLYHPHHPHLKGRMMMATTTPFWRRPLSLTMGSENEGSVSSRVDIQQKLQEKKQQQLAELREIEEEIKQGKLKRPELHEIIPQPVNGRQPIPIEKKQPWFGGATNEDGGVVLDLSQRCHIPLIPAPHEILLDPQYLMYASPTTNVPPMMMGGGVSGGDHDGFYYNPDWPAVNYYEPLYQNRMGDGDSGDGGTSPQPPSAGGGCGDGENSGKICDRRRRSHKPYFEPSSRESIYKSYRIPSDIDSQMSLPRSYTLPREFKYKRKFRKPVKTENFLPSTNSSDGKKNRKIYYIIQNPFYVQFRRCDVDSGGEDPDLYSQVRPYPLPLPSMHHIHTSPSSAIIVGGGGVGAASTSGAEASVTLSPILPLPTGAPGPSPSALTPAARQSRKVPNGRPRHKLHETKL